MKNQISYSSLLQSEISKQGLIYYLSFLVWPFGVMVDALRNWRQPWAKNVFWFFCIFFGYTFIIAENTEDAADSARYAEVLLQYSHSDMNLKTLFKSFYSENSSDIDIIQQLITYLISRVSTNPHILFAVFAMIFGFFHSRNLWYILNKLKGRLNPFLFLLIFVFVLLNPIWSINGFRMWTAAQVFIYGTLPFLLEGKTKKLVWSASSIFFHFSFIIPLVLLFIYVIAKNRITVYVVLFILTSFLKEIDLYLVQSYLSFLPSVFYSRTVSYTNIEYAESVATAAQELNWYLPLAAKSLTWVIYMFILYIYFFDRNSLKEQGSLVNLFCFSTFFYSTANLMSLVPSGGRFLNVSSTLVFGFLVIFLSYSKNTNNLKILKSVSIPLLLLFTLVMVRIGMDYYGFATIIGNPVFAVLGAKSVPLITEIKNLL